MGRAPQHPSVKPQHAQTLSPAPNRSRVLLGLGLALLCVVIAVSHWPSLSAQALSIDDSQYLTENPLVQNPSWASARRFLVEVRDPSTVRGYYQPLTMISLMADHALGGRVDNLRPFHRTQLALHVLNATLVVVLLYQLFGHGPVALLVGLLFGLHPITVEPICWISERKTLLASFFALIALLQYVRFTRRGGRWRFATSLVAYALAMLAKPTAVPLPLCLLVLDFWPLRRLGRRTLAEKLPFLAIGAVFAVVTVLSQGSRAGVALPTELPPLAAPLTILHDTVFYLSKIAWPTNLSSNYPIPQPMDLSHPMILAGALGTCLLVAVLLVSLRWTRAPMAGWLIFTLMLLPTMGVVKFTNVIAADKYAYLPLVGLLMALAAGLVRLWPTAASLQGRAGLVCAAVAVIAGLEIHVTHLQLGTWQTSETHYRHMLSLAPNAAILHHGLGNALLGRREYPEAISEIRQALALEPRDLEARLGLAIALAQTGRVDDAIAEYRMILRANPKFPQAHNNLANLLLGMGSIDEAIGHLEAAVALDPAYAAGFYNLANTLAQSGRPAQAIDQYRKALAIQPRFPSAWANLGMTLAEAGSANEAIVALRTAAQLEPRSTQIGINLGIALSDMKRYDDAAAEFRRVLELDPSNALAHDMLDRVSAGQPAQR